MCQKNSIQQEVQKILPKKIWDKLSDCNWNELNEIRLRANQKVELVYRTNVQSLDEVVHCDLLQTIYSGVTYFSGYAFENQLKQGFVTASGGHRIGICGKVIYEDERIKTINPITSINIRIAHQRIGCSRELIQKGYPTGVFANSLLISKPGIGKTTLLRDLIRSLSMGDGWQKSYKVGVVDERCEIASCHIGRAGHDLGPRTDILDCCQKADGMMILVRSMSPDIVAVDEIGHQKDSDSILYCANCGCHILATIHGESVEQIAKKEGMSELLANHIFHNFIVMERDGEHFYYHIFDENAKKVGDLLV